MSDWDDDDSNIIAQPAPKQSRQCNDDDWDDEPQNPPPQQQQRQYDDRNDSSRNREYSGRDSSRNGEPRRSNYNNNSNMDGNDERQLTFSVSQTAVGLVIGRGGSNIKDLEQRFRVKVNIDKNTGGGNATVTIKGATQDAQDAKRKVEDLVGSQRSYDNRGSDGQNRGSNNFGGNRSANRSDDNRGYNSQSQQRNPFSNSASSTNNRSNDYANSAPPNNDTSEPIEYEMIDWQAAARESEEQNRKRWALLPPLQKDFYKEHPDVANMSPEKVAAIRLKNNNTTVSRLFLDDSDDASAQNAKANDIPNPVETFEQCFGQYEDIMEQIQKQGFATPSPIQAQAWPVLLKGEDLIGIAQTGTGKTLAFLLPAMLHTEYQLIPRSERKGPNVLVLAPTRELALQIEKEVAKYSFRGMKAVCVYGGGDRKAQISNITDGVEIIIATPGRLNDLVEAKVIDVCTITFLILDEADRMLDMGFEPQIRKILLDIRPDRQTVMTSATWPSGVRRLAQRYMANPIQVCIGTLDLAAVHSVTQVIKIIDEDNKFRELMNFVKNQMDPEEKAIIFCGKKARADDLSSEFSLAGIAVQCMHGNRDQADREQALVDIKEGVVKILIATDVASRGIDIQDLSYVINYDFPRNIEEYVHRVGRTGRAGRTGKSISYVTRSDWASAAELINILEEAEQEVPDELRDMKKRFDDMQARKERERASLGGGGGRRFGGGGGGGGGGGRFGGGGGGGRSRY